MTTTTEHNQKGRKSPFLYPALGIFSISLLVFSAALIDFQEISAIKSPKDFEAVLGPHQIVFDGIDDTSPWESVTAQGHASFSVNRDMTEIHYKIHLDDIENVVGIIIGNGAIGENTVDGSSIEFIRLSYVGNPEDFQDRAIEGILNDDDICVHPEAIEGSLCSVYGLVNEIINHRAFLLVSTNDGDLIRNTGPGDLSHGEIRGQIYPMITRIFETQIDSSNQMLDETIDHQMWNLVDSEGSGRFMINDDMTEISYELNFKNLENVVGIHIHNGDHNENSHIHLVDLKPTDITNPENFSPGTITGVIYNEDICPNDNSDSKKCNVIGLMNEFQNHDAYIQVHTDSDGDLSTNTGPGDLGSPGEIRGQIYPSPECNECVVNVEDQILTIFKFETEDMPFLANEATFLVTPNPFSHNVGGDFIDPQKFGVNLMITDNDLLDSDPTLGVIELLGVNEGVYSVIELKGPPGLIKTEETFSTHEITGNSNSHVQVTNIAIDFENLDGPIFFDAPLIDEDALQHLQSLNAKINGVTITSPDQIPPSMMTSYSEIFSGNPPPYIEFANIVNSNLNIDEIFVLLGILTYDSPSQTSSTEGMTLMPPLFLAENTDGSDLVFSPLFDEVHPGTDLFLRLDGIDSSDLDGTAIAGVHLPMDQYGTDFGLSVEIIEPTEDMIENTNEVLILDIDHVGTIDLGDESVFSEPPTIDFRVPTIEGTLNCPDGVEVYLQDDDTMELNPVTPAPERNMSLDTVNSCGYTQTLLHFSTYVIATGSSGGASGDSSSGGGSGSSGHDHSSHDHGDGSTGGGDSSRRTDSEIAQETLEAGGRLIGKFETFEFGRQDQSTHLVFGKNDFIELGLSASSHLATLTVLEQGSSDFGFNFEYGGFEGTRLIAEIDKSQIPIKYSLNGKISHLMVDEQSKSIMFGLEDVSQDEMMIILPKVLIDAENDNFIILVSASPEQEIDYEVIQSTDDFVTLKMEMPQDAKTLTIVGTKVIPEFGLISTLILFMSFSMFVVLFKIKRLSTNIKIRY